VYAIGANGRHPTLPNVPTTREVGLPNLDAPPWWALFAPKGTPRPILDKFADALDKSLDDSNTHKRFLELGGDIPNKARRGPESLTAQVKADIARWTPIIKAANIRAE
jgi:tripartite-type tricarboxylate transporter receptor subunit TctC